MKQATTCSVAAMQRILGTFDCRIGILIVDQGPHYVVTHSPVESPRPDPCRWRRFARDESSSTAPRRGRAAVGEEEARSCEVSDLSVSMGRAESCRYV